MKEAMAGVDSSAAKTKITASKGKTLQRMKRTKAAEIACELP